MSDTFAVAIRNSIYELMEIQASLALRKPSLMDLPNFPITGITNQKSTSWKSTHTAPNVEFK